MKQWPVIGLLFLSACINYIDRGSLSLAAPALSAELDLSPIQVGVLLSAFFWTYALCQTFAGLLIDRFPVRWVFGAGFFIWSAATASAGFSTGLESLIVTRLLLGVGESAAFPSYSKIITAGFPIERRGLPNSLVEAGTKLGPAVGALIGGIVLARYGWRMMFWFLGAGSLVWLIPWMIWAPRPATTVAAGPGARVPLADSPGVLEILKRKDAWGTFIGNACYTYSYFFLLTWLPSYLVRERHVPIAKLAVLGSIPFWGSAVSAVVCGWASDAWIRRGGSPTRVRKTFVVTGLLLSMIMLPSAMVADLNLSIFLLCVAYAAFGMYASNHWAITQTLAGPAAAGKWSGLQNTLGACSGVVAPIVTGFIVQKTGVFFLAFLSPAILALAGACCYLFLIGQVAPVDWRRPVTAA